MATALTYLIFGAFWITLAAIVLVIVGFFITIPLRECIRNASDRQEKVLKEIESRLYRIELNDSRSSARTSSET
jgi:hypothetical protein